MTDPSGASGQANVIPFVPEEPEFDQAEVRGLLLELNGNVTEAAKLLGVDVTRLRIYVYAMPALKRALDEVLDQRVDAAIDVLYEGLRDEGSFQNRYYAAKEFLRSNAGKRRGFGPREQAAMALEVKTDRPATIALKWLEPPKEE
jgi:hypothetical protein